jgi:DNA polymerase-4
MELSRRIVGALADFSPLVEQASIDEAYLDATGLQGLFGPPNVMAMAVKARIHEVTGGLTCSVGVAPVKFLAKIVSDINKPDGLFMLAPEEVDAFLLRLPVSKIPGVGKQTLARLNRLGISTAGDVRRYPEEFWEERFGKAGASIYRKAHGLGSATVTPWRPPKSESAENTFAADTLDQDILKSWLMRQAERVGASLRRHGLAGRTITLKIKYADFRQITRSKSLAEPTDSTRAIFEEACRLLDALRLADKVRLIGLGVSNFDGGSRQLPLPLGDAEIRDADARKRLDQAMDAVRERFGKNAIQRGRALETKE